MRKLTKAEFATLAAAQALADRIVSKPEDFDLYSDDFQNFEKVSRDADEVYDAITNLVWSINEACDNE